MFLQVCKKYNFFFNYIILRADKLPPVLNEVVGFKLQAEWVTES